MYGVRMSRHIFTFDRSKEICGPHAKVACLKAPNSPWQASTRVALQLSLRPLPPPRATRNLLRPIRTPSSFSFLFFSGGGVDLFVFFGGRGGPTHVSPSRNYWGKTKPCALENTSAEQNTNRENDVEKQEKNMKEKQLFQYGISKKATTEKNQHKTDAQKT